MSVYVDNKRAEWRRGVAPFLSMGVHAREGFLKGLFHVLIEGGDGGPGPGGGREGAGCRRLTYCIYGEYTNNPFPCKICVEP